MAELSQRVEVGRFRGFERQRCERLLVVDQ